jgi:hypothetical protein
MRRLAALQLGAVAPLASMVSRKGACIVCGVIFRMRVHCAAYKSALGSSLHLPTRYVAAGRMAACAALRQVAYTPRMPPPALVPAPPPVPSKKKGGSKKASKGSEVGGSCAAHLLGSPPACYAEAALSWPDCSGHPRGCAMRRGATAERAPPSVPTHDLGSCVVALRLHSLTFLPAQTPLGAKDAAATVAAACLRFLSLLPQFLGEFMRECFRGSRPARATPASSSSHTHSSHSLQRGSHAASQGHGGQATLAARPSTRSSLSSVLLSSMGQPGLQAPTRPSATRMNPAPRSLLPALLAGTNTLPQVVNGLLTCGEEQAAYLSGILWELSAEAPVAEEGECGC